MTIFRQTATQLSAIKPFHNFEFPCTILHPHRDHDRNLSIYLSKSFRGLAFATAPLSLLREHLVFSLFFHLYSFLSLFSLIFLSYHCFTYIFLITILLELIFFLHVSSFSWLFLITLCRSFHIFSSVLFFVLLSCPPNSNSPRTWSVSSILSLCKAMLSIHHSSHLGQCRMKRSSVCLSSLHPIHISLFFCQ